MASSLEKMGKQDNPNDHLQTAPVDKNLQDWAKEHGLIGSDNKNQGEGQGGLSPNQNRENDHKMNPEWKGNPDDNAQMAPVNPDHVRLAVEQGLIDEAKAREILAKIRSLPESGNHGRGNIVPESVAQSSRSGEVRMSQSVILETPSVPASSEMPKENGFFSSLGKRLREWFRGGKKEVLSSPATETVSDVRVGTVEETEGGRKEEKRRKRDNEGKTDSLKAKKEEGERSELPQEVKDRLDEIAKDRRKIRKLFEENDGGLGVAFGEGGSSGIRKELMRACVESGNMHTLFGAIKQKWGEESPGFLALAKNDLLDLIPNICEGGSEGILAEFVSNSRSDEIKENFILRILEETKNLPGMQVVMKAFQVRDVEVRRRIVDQYTEKNYQEKSADPDDKEYFRRRVFEFITPSR